MKSLHEVCKTKDIEKAKKLIEEGCDLEEKNRFGMTPLLTAADEFNKEMIELLVKKGADIHVTDGTGENVLFYFTIDDDGEEFIEYFLDLGCNPEIRDHSGFNLIDDILYINKHHVDIQKKLLLPLFKRIDKFSEDFQKQLRAVRLELLF